MAQNKKLPKFYIRMAIRVPSVPSALFPEKPVFIRTVPISSAQDFKETCRSIMDLYTPDWKVRRTKVPPVFSPAVRSLQRIALLSRKKEIIEKKKAKEEKGKACNPHQQKDAGRPSVTSQAVESDKHRVTADDSAKRKPPLQPSTVEDEAGLRKTEIQNTLEKAEEAATPNKAEKEHQPHKEAGQPTVTSQAGKSDDQPVAAEHSAKISPPMQPSYVEHVGLTKTKIQDALEKGEEDTKSKIEHQHHKDSGLPTVTSQAVKPDDKALIGKDSAKRKPPLQPSSVEDVFGLRKVEIQKTLKEAEKEARSNKAEKQIFMLMSSVAEAQDEEENLKIISGFDLTEKNWIDRLVSLGSAEAKDTFEKSEVREQKHEMDLVVIDMNRRRFVIFEVKYPEDSLNDDIQKLKNWRDKRMSDARTQTRESKHLLLNVFKLMEVADESSLDNLWFQTVVAVPFHDMHKIDEKFHRQPQDDRNMFLIGAKECSSLADFKKWWKSGEEIKKNKEEERIFQEVSCLLLSIASMLLEVENKDEKEETICYGSVQPEALRLSDQAVAVKLEIKETATPHHDVVEYLTKSAEHAMENVMFYPVPEQLEAFNGKTYQIFYGPQGTGKTLLFMQKITQLMNVGEHVLLVAPENLIYFYHQKIKNKSNMPQHKHNLLLEITPGQLSDHWECTDGSWNIFVDELDALLDSPFSYLAPRLMERMTMNFFQKKEQQKYCWLGCSYIENPTALFHTFFSFDRTLLTNVLRSTVEHMETMKIFGTIISSKSSHPSKSLPYPEKTDPWPMLYHNFSGLCGITYFPHAAKDLDKFINNSAERILEILSSFRSKELEAGHVGMSPNLFNSIAVLTITATAASKLRDLLMQKITCPENLTAVSDIKFQLTKGRSLIAVDEAYKARGLDWSFVIVVWEHHPEFRKGPSFQMLQFMLGRSTFYAHVIACYQINLYQAIKSYTMDYHLDQFLLMVVSVSWFAFNSVRKHFCDLMWDPSRVNAMSAMRRALKLNSDLQSALALDLVVTQRANVLQHRNIDPAVVTRIQETIVKTVEDAVKRLENKLHTAEQQTDEAVINDALFAFEQCEIAFNGAVTKVLKGITAFNKNPGYVLFIYQQMDEAFKKFEQAGVFPMQREEEKKLKSNLKELVEKLLKAAQTAVGYGEKSGCPEDVSFPDHK